MFTHHSSARRVLRVAVPLLTLLMLPVLCFAQTSPDEFLGFRVGTDRTLADYDKMRSYFERLDQESRPRRMLSRCDADPQ